jgi:hypothetical protein
MKSQTIRLLDVLVIGPAMVSGGAALAKETPARRTLGALLLAAGAGTIIYNGHNWRAHKR